MKKISRITLVIYTIVGFALATVSTLIPVVYWTYLIVVGVAGSVLAFLGLVTTLITQHKELTVKTITKDPSRQVIAGLSYLWYNALSSTTSTSLGIFLAFQFTGMVGLGWVALIYWVGGLLLATGRYRLYKVAQSLSSESTNE